MAALDPTFDRAILQIAAGLFPAGFDTGPDAPNTLEGLTAHVRATGRMLVWNGASTGTIFGSPEVNFAFRAWHDAIHVLGNHAFTLEGELEVAEVQKAWLRSHYPNHPNLSRWVRLIDIEVVEQSKHFAAYGAFPEDQRAFAEGLIGTLRS